MNPGDLEAIRTVIRDEINPLRSEMEALRSEMEALRSEMEAGFERVSKEFADLREHLEGLIDADFPPVDQRPRHGGSGPSNMRIAAKRP